MRNAVVGLALACGVASLAGPARAQDMQAGIDRCRAISSDLQRLSCFDALAKGPPKTADGAGPAAQADAPRAAPPAPRPDAPAVTAPGGSTGRWLHRQSRDGLDNSVTEAILLPSTEANIGFLGKPGMREKPALIVRCKKGQAAIYIAFDVAVTTSDPRVPVQFRIDDTGPTSAVWGRSENDQGIGLWTNEAALALIRQLSGGHDFFVRATPPMKGTTDARFDVTGMDAALAPLRGECGL
jgi:type VI secretion system VasI family protein